MRRWTPFANETSSIVPIAKARACAILAEFNKAQTELIGKAVVLTDGKAGTVNEVWLDELHGLRISIEGHEGKWPVSTIKFAEALTARSVAKLEMANARIAQDLPI
jgi:hypothetical protein